MPNPVPRSTVGKSSATYVSPTPHSQPKVAMEMAPNTRYSGRVSEVAPHAVEAISIRAARAAEGRRPIRSASAVPMKTNTACSRKKTRA
ncbi:Uncharacterised protein [Mycobacteroides abscessus subsp. abscessus]|nr:Uncharacterised protein [Mycobacteroides abscessus subsp. abscessus]